MPINKIEGTGFGEDETHRFVTDTEKAIWNSGTGGGGGIGVYDVLPTPNATLLGKDAHVRGLTNISEVVQLTIANPCTANGNVTVTLDGVAKTVALTTVSNTAALVAGMIRGTAFPGWVLGGSGAVVTFTSTTFGDKGTNSYSPGTSPNTGASGTLTTTTQGRAGTPDTRYICTKLADDTFGWLAVDGGTVINVLDYGAKGDGSHDDTDAFKRAINALKFNTFQEGGYIYNGKMIIPKGLYKLTDELIIPFMTGFHIEGDSRGGTVIRQFTNNKPIFRFGTVLTHSWKISNMALGYNTQQTTAHTMSAPIYFDLITPGDGGMGYFNFEIENCTLTGGYYGILLNPNIALTAWGMTARKCNFGNMAGGAVKLLPEPAIGQPIIKMEDCYIHGHGMAERAIWIGYCDTVLLDTVEFNEGDFPVPLIDITTCYNVTLINCRTENVVALNPSAGNFDFWTFPNSNVQIIGCAITNIPLSGGGTIRLVNAGTNGSLTVMGLIGDCSFPNGGNGIVAKADNFIYASALRVSTASTPGTMERYSTSWTPRVDADLAQPNGTIDQSDANLIINLDPNLNPPPSHRHKVHRFNTMTANRTVTLPSTNLYDGMEYTFIKNTIADYTLSITDPTQGRNATLAAGKRSSVTYRVTNNLWYPYARSSNLDTDDTSSVGTTVPVTEGNTAVGFGDSITIGNTDVTNTAYGDTSWFQQFIARSKGKLRYLYNAGIGGNTTAMMLARIQTDVIAYKPKLCFILGGTNDVGNGIAHTATRINIESMITTLMSNGIMPVLCTIPPRNDATKLGVARVNMVVRNLATKYALHLLDFFPVLTDPATGNFKAGYNDGDGIHPNQSGAKAMSLLAETTIMPLLPAVYTPLTVYNANPMNVIPNGLFIGDTNADGVSDSWITYGGGTFTTTIVTGDTAIIGNWQQLVMSASGTRYLENTITTGYVVGDRLCFFGRVSAVVEAGSGVYDLRVTFNGASANSIKIFSNWTKDIADGAFYHEFVVPAATTSISFHLIHISGTGTYKLAQVGAYNLTQNNL